MNQGVRCNLIMMENKGDVTMTNDEIDQISKEFISDNPLILLKLKNECDIAEPQEAMRGVSEVVKFLYLCSTGSSALTPSNQVDQIWHQLILFTRAYGRLCKDHFGEFIHHQPSDDREQDRNQYQFTLLRYRQTFGVPHTDYWTDAGICKNHCGSCENIS